MLVREVDAYDEDDSSKAARARRANLERWAARVVAACVDDALECSDDATRRERLDQRLAFAEELRLAGQAGMLPLEFSSSKKQKQLKKKKKDVPSQKKKKTADAENRYAGDEVPDRYWAQRHLYFHLYDEGIELDAESWYSVTPECIARRIALRAEGRFVLDAFCGCGGNAIQFALAGCFVLAVDLDARKLRMARHNARLYDVSHRIDFLRADAVSFLETTLSRTGGADFVFLSPPWGGPDYPDDYDPARDLVVGRVNGLQLAALAAAAAPNLGFFLPKTTPLAHVLPVARAFSRARPRPSSSSSSSDDEAPDVVAHFESHYLNGRLKAKTLFLGPDCTDPAFLTSNDENEEEEAVEEYS